tara:strand:+ start:6212 stop:6400 length:189 start_codon:yes stop_codon:yes gene_type:complete
MSINEENLRLEIEKTYTPAELIELLDIPMEKVLDFIIEDVYDNIEIFKDIIKEPDNEEEDKI